MLHGIFRVSFRSRVGVSVWREHLLNCVSLASVEETTIFVISVISSEFVFVCTLELRFGVNIFLPVVGAPILLCSAVVELA